MTARRSLPVPSSSRDSTVSRTSRVGVRRAVTGGDLDVGEGDQDRQDLGAQPVEQLEALVAVQPVPDRVDVGPAAADVLALPGQDALGQLR